MLKQLKRDGSPLPVLALSAFLAMTISATAQTPFARECALKDITAITMIEDHGNAGDVSGERLGNAWLAMLDARSACSKGRVGEALALYQSIFDLEPVSPIRSERR